MKNLQITVFIKYMILIAVSILLTFSTAGANEVWKPYKKKNSFIEMVCNYFSKENDDKPINQDLLIHRNSAHETEIGTTNSKEEKPVTENKNNNKISPKPLTNTY